jgi:hypothetical protein
MNTIREQVRRSCWLGAALLVAAAASAEESTSIGKAIDAIKPIADTRLRFEDVDPHSASPDAEAVTMRARLGFETGKVWNTTLLAEGEFVWSLDDHYNSTTNGNTQYPVVADPQGSEFNRLQLTNTSIAKTTVTLGRQRINLDDQRFVGNGGWRQNEQTFDAVRLVNRSVSNLIVDLSYLNQVNRVYGTDSVQGRYEGDTALANVSYKFPVGLLTGFGYRVEIDPLAGVPAAVRDSSTTVGARFAGEHPLNKRAAIAYAASYATQQDSASNPLSFDLNYYLAELTGRYDHYSLRVGTEVLQGDGVKGFTTPLATLHPFQGWADKFLTTPANGIDDRYVNGGLTWQHVGPLDSISAQATYHWYDAERGTQSFGSETDAQLLLRWHKFSGLLKYADFRGEGPYTDTSKFWAQLEYVW